MFPLVPLALSLADVIPDIVGFIKGDKAQERAEKIINVAKSVTGIKDEKEAVKKILENPELALQFRQKMAEIQLEFYREDTKRLEIINKTMIAEYNSKDKFKTGWRPYIGWILGTSLGFYMFTLCYAVIYAIHNNPEQIGIIVDGLAKLVSALTTTWSVCLVVLGVAIKKRSDDKRLAIGNVSKTNILENVTNFIKGGK